MGVYAAALHRAASGDDCALRLTTADGVELNVRRPLTRQQQRKLEKLLVSAREIFEEP